MRAEARRQPADGEMAEYAAPWDASHAVGGGCGGVTRDHGNGRKSGGKTLVHGMFERAHRLTGQTGRRLWPAEPRADIIDRDVRWSGPVEGEEDARERE